MPDFAARLITVRCFTWNDETLEIHELVRWGERGRGWVRGDLLLKTGGENDRLARELLQSNIEALQAMGWRWVPPGSNLILPDLPTEESHAEA